MRALVTGGAGFIGTNLIKRLLKDGHEVVSIDNYSTGKKENHQEGCKYLDMDLAVSTPKYGSWGQGKFQLEEPDVIYHLAALPRIQPSFEDPLATFNANVLSTLHILEYARKNNIRVIYAGSSSVHGGAYKNPYTFTKWQGDKLCHMYSEIYKVNVNVCRFYNVYGPRQIQAGNMATVIGIFEKKYLDKKALTVVNPGFQTRKFTHVKDIVNGCYEAWKKNLNKHYY